MKHIQLPTADTEYSQLAATKLARLDFRRKLSEINGREEVLGVVHSSFRVCGGFRKSQRREAREQQHVIKTK